MPSDSNGVYSLPDVYLAETGELVIADQHNKPLEDIAEAISGRLPTSGAAAMKGPLKGVPGAVGAPSFTFSSDTTTGFYKTAGGVGLSIGGALVAEFVPGGLKTGGRYIGELIPYTGSTPRALTVFPFGQTLSRATYAELWQHAQTEITAGNAFYNNGNGVDTFGIGDLRGRVVAAFDAMGGTAAGRLTGTMGAGIGAQSTFLTEGQLPSVAKTLTGSTETVVVQSDVNNWVFGGVPSTGLNNGIFQIQHLISAATAAVTSYGSFTPHGYTAFGGGGSHDNRQPTLVASYLLFAGA